MKLLFKSLCVSVIISMIFTLVPFNAECESVSEDVFRLHILANSDSDEDQKLKLEARNQLLSYTDEIYLNAKSKEEAVKQTNINLQQIVNVAQDVVQKNGYKYQVTAEVCDDFFDTRTYDNVTMPSGMYKALKVTIGSGKGHNWWCVMYPSLCVGSATNIKALENNLDDKEFNLLTKEKCEYKFKIIEYFNEIKEFFD